MKINLEFDLSWVALEELYFYIPPSERPLTWSEVVSPLAAAVYLVHGNTTQQVGVVGFLQTRHEQLALGDLLRRHIQQLERGLGIRHSSHDGLGVLLKCFYYTLYYFFHTMEVDISHQDINISDHGPFGYTFCGAHYLATLAKRDNQVIH